MDERSKRARKRAEPPETNATRAADEERDPEDAEITIKALEGKPAFDEEERDDVSTDATPPAPRPAKARRRSEGGKKEVATGAKPTKSERPPAGRVARENRTGAP
jgi:hypothetical protein